MQHSSDSRCHLHFTVFCWLASRCSLVGAMAPHLKLEELDYMQSLEQRGKTPMEIHNLVSLKRDRQGVSTPCLKRIRHALRGLTYKRAPPGRQCVVCLNLYPICCVGSLGTVVGTPICCRDCCRDPRDRCRDCCRDPYFLCRDPRDCCRDPYVL